MIIDMTEGEEITIRHKDYPEMFIVVQAKYDMILNRTDADRNRRNITEK